MFRIWVTDIHINNCYRMSHRSWCAFLHLPKANPSVWVICYNHAVPTVLRLPGLRVVVYPNDHRPAHVHVIGNGHEAIYELNRPDGPVSLRENFGFAQHELTSIQKALSAHVQQLCKAWEGIHGHA